MAPDSDVTRLAESDHLIEQILMLIQRALSGRDEPVLPAKARLERRLVEVFEKYLAVLAPVGAFELKARTRGGASEYAP